MTTEQPSADMVWRRVAEERATLVELLTGFDESEWDAASLCSGWRVRDVVAHLVLATRFTLGTILVELVRARGNIDRLIRDSAVRYADRTTTGELLAQLRETIGSRTTPIGTTPLDRLMDLLVHGQDIAVPLGIERVAPTEPAQWSLERVWAMGAPFHARKRLAGYRLCATDTGWTAGSGTEVTGTAAELLMLVTGRAECPTAGGRVALPDAGGGQGD